MVAAIPRRRDGPAGMHGQISALDQRTAYRPEIDGLRAVAVLSVLVYHYSAPFPWPLLPGGFTGVDVFFVISGFLITSKLSDDIRSGTFSILEFYDRRIRRILPALLVMLAVTLLAGQFLLMPGDYKAMAASAAAAAFGASNFFFLFNTSYFDQAANLMPLLHTWSLGVEEQFYLVWPILLLVIATGRKHVDTAAILGVTVIVGLGASLLWFDSDPKAAFFMALPRAWELALGASLVFLRPLPRAFGEIATAIGLVLIGAGFVLVSDASFPGPAALYPCIGAALVIWPREGRTTAAAWLGRLRHIGLISYSLYLWHWPVWVMYRIFINNGVPRIREAAALALLSILLAALSYRFVEQPCRKRHWRPTHSVGAGLAACTVLFCAAMFVHSKEGMPERIPAEAFAMRSLDAMWEWQCPRQSQYGPVCSVGAAPSSAKMQAIIIGDSHASQMLPLLDVAGAQINMTIDGPFSSCTPLIQQGGVQRILAGDPRENENCGSDRSNILALIKSSPEIKFAIIVSRWSAYLDQLYLPGKRVENSVARGLSLMEGSLGKLVEDIDAIGRKVILFGDLPELGFDPIGCLHAIYKNALWRAKGGCSGRLDAIPRQQYEQANGAVNKLLLRVASQHENARAYLPSERLCDVEHCITKIDNEFLFRDDNHIRRNLSPDTIRELIDLMRLPEALHRDAGIKADAQQRR